MTTFLTKCNCKTYVERWWTSVAMKLSSHCPIIHNSEVLCVRVSLSAGNTDIKKENKYQYIYMTHPHKMSRMSVKLIFCKCHFHEKKLEIFPNFLYIFIDSHHCYHLIITISCISKRFL